jgi:RHS repeat-associated protein
VPSSTVHLVVVRVSVSTKLLLTRSRFGLSLTVAFLLSALSLAGASVAQAASTVGKPTGTVAGDLLVVGLAFEKGSDVAITPPSGWTLIRRTNQSSNVGHATYRKVAGASEPASYAFALTNSPKWSLGGCAIAGAHATTPIDAHNGASGSSGNPSAPSLTTTGPSRLVLAFYANKKPATFSNYTSPAIERFDAPNTSGGLPSNAMASYEQPAAGASGAKSATPSEQAEWVAQQIAIAPGASVSKFLWDVNHALPQLALERNGNDVLQRQYLYGLARIRQTAGTASYYHSDGLGSVSNLTSDTGASQRTLSYEPFGELRTNTGSGPASSLKFTGEYEDGTGLYHLRARQYDPTTGRFLSRDPVPSSGSAYAYVGNSPTAFVDPAGALPNFIPNFITGPCLFCGGDASETGHLALDTYGLAPYVGEIFDLINCAWYGAEGDELNAGLSCGSAVPWAGYLATGVKFGRRFDAALDAAKAGRGASAGPARSPSFIAHPNGEIVPVPKGATGPAPVRGGNGFQFTGGSGGYGLDPRVTNVRVMGPTPPGAQYPYPRGYVSYSNAAGQAINPYTGRTISRSDPFWHWAWSP